MYGGLTTTPGDESGESYQTLPEASVAYHARYNPSNLANDLGMLRLTKVIPAFTARVAPINLPPAGADYQGFAVSIVGWGVTENGCEYL